MMVTTSLLKFQARAFFFLAFLLCDTTAFGFGSKAKDTSTLLQTDQPKDLGTLIRPVPEDQSRIYTQALELLSSMQASPSCHRLATSTLLDSCQSIDGSKHDSEVSHDYMRSIYAAQLAVCEIQSAESKVPPSCETLIPTGKADLFPKLGSQSVPRAHLSHCLQALETRPQWWTSYSNSRQNAVVICQAARADIEKDELIKLHKSSVQINQDADAALAQAVEYSEEALRQKHEEFALAKRTLQDQLIQEIKIASGTAQSLLGKVMIGLNASVQTILMRLTSATRSVETDVANLRQNIHAASAESQDLEKNVGKVFQKAAEGTSELASIQTRHLDESNELALGLRLSLHQMKEVDVHNLVMVIREMYGQMQNTNELVVSVSARQDSVDIQMNRLGQLMIGLQGGAQALQDAQLRQEYIQTRLHNAMEVSLNASLAQVSVIERSTASLQAALQDASKSITQIAYLAWIMNMFWMWGSLAVVLALAMFGIFRVNAKFARIIAGATGFMVVVKCSTALLIELAHGRSPLHIHFPLEHLLLFGFVIGVLISVGLFYHRLSDPSDMYFIGCTSSERKIRRMRSV